MSRPKSDQKAQAVTYHNTTFLPDEQPQKVVPTPDRKMKVTQLYRESSEPRHINDIVDLTLENNRILYQYQSAKPPSRLRNFLRKPKIKPNEIGLVELLWTRENFYQKNKDLLHSLLQYPRAIILVYGALSMEFQLRNSSVFREVLPLFTQWSHNKASENILVISTPMKLSEYQKQVVRFFFQDSLEKFSI